MTDSYPSTTPDDIITEGDDMSRRLEREADALLAGSPADTGSSAAASGPNEVVASLRQAVREDAGKVKALAQTTAADTRERIVEEPLKATFYALIAGVLLGVLISR